MWNVGPKNVKELIKSANRYAVLDENEGNEEMNKSFTDRRIEVDKFINEQRQPNCDEEEDWTYDMKEYFKYKWKEVCRNNNGNQSDSDEDVVCEEIDTAKKIVDDVIDRLCTKDKQNEIKELIHEENLSVCGVLETHLKDDKVNKIGNMVLGNWNWCSNAQYKSIQKNVKFFCSFIYASNSQRERQDLWRDLHTHKGIASNKPWILMGDFNVTLKTNKHSSGSSIMNGDMVDLNECVSSLELEDIYSTNHSPAVITIPNGLRKKRKSFRFVNYIPDKEEEWKFDREGCRVEKDPFNCELKEKAVKLLNEYMAVSNDELKILKHKGRIKSICDENGIRFDGDNVDDAFVDHFKKFLGIKHVVQPLNSVDINFVKVLDENKANSMISIVTDDEIKEAIFDIDSNKASGPDGYTSGFKKKAWSIIKSISKILTNRIKTGLQKVVNLNQSAFIPGRHIEDNILIAQGLLKGYKRKNGAKRCALKIDIQKAYDTHMDIFKKVAGFDKETP
ncbi:RNA-directed DNA polymerase, eukaryota, reverse transcriptase zinc-binding domain protein [Tanacetum coccineum]